MYYVIFHRTIFKNNVIGYYKNNYRNNINIRYNHKTIKLFELQKFFSLSLIESLKITTLI